MSQTPLAIPPRLSQRPRDPRGFPIPFAQWIAEDGTPDFRILDQERVGRCLRLRLCGLCGHKMGGHLFFIGGPACVRHGQFYDPAMCRDCALFALKTCPHLARSKGRYSDPAAVPVAPGYKFAARDMAPDKADSFALMETNQYSAEFQRGGYLIRARLPWAAVVWYRDALPVTPA
jgi:hypothetical protein